MVSALLQPKHSSVHSDKQESPNPLSFFTTKSWNSYRYDFHLTSVHGNDFTFEKADLSAYPVKRFDISGHVRCNFSQITMQDVSFKNAILHKASFAGATLINVDFSGADLTGTDFTGTVFNNVSFIGAILTNVVFRGAALYNVKFRDAHHA